MAPVSTSFEVTLSFLATTENEAATGLLLPALDSVDPVVQEGALVAALRRRSPEAQALILSRLGGMDERWKSIIDGQRGALTIPLREALLGSDTTLRSRALRAVVWFHEYDLAATIVELVETRDATLVEEAATALLDLARAFHDEWTSGRAKAKANPRDPSVIRRGLTSALEQSAARFERHGRREPLEAFLILANRDNVTLKQILHEPKIATHAATIDLLLSSRHPGVSRLLLGFLEDAQPPLSALHALSQRGDAWFVEQFLSKASLELSLTARQNLVRIDDFAWLRDDFSLLEPLSDAAQAGACRVIRFANVDRDLAWGTIARLIDQGKPRARLAAIASLARFPTAAAEELTVRLVSDADPEARAAALAQLRDRDTPGAMNLLTDALDSEYAVVREAARASLSDFNVERFLANFDLMDDDERRRAGALVKKVDSRAIATLRGELETPSRRRRTRAIEVAGAMDMLARLDDALAVLAADEDLVVRVESLRALGDADSRVAREALELAVVDDSDAAREAARESLRRLESRRRTQGRESSSLAGPNTKGAWSPLGAHS